MLEIGKPISTNADFSDPWGGSLRWPTRKISGRNCRDTGWVEILFTCTSKGFLGEFFGEYSILGDDINPLSRSQVSAVSCGVWVRADEELTPLGSHSK
jgi:hypothetical protein